MNSQSIGSRQPNQTRISKLELKDQKQGAILQEAKDQMGQKQDSPIMWGYFFLFSYLYILMGALSGIIGTMPYVYQDLPNIDTMSLFNATNLPFSFKFLIAPFMQKFSLIQYGKRKTWILISLILGGITILISGFYTEENYANLYAILGIVSQSWMVVLDIACHSIMIKQIKSVNQNSIILSYGQTAGLVLGGLIILKFTSQQFSQSVGLAHPITSPKTIMLVFAVMLMIPILIAHFFLSQTTLQSQKKSNQFTFCQIISYFSIFLMCVFFLLSGQGLNFFNSLYDYELVQRGFSRDTSNDLGNLITVPIVVATFYMSTWTKFFGGKTKSMIIIYTGSIIIDAFILIYFPLQVWLVGITGFLSNLLDAWRFFILAMLINQFPAHALTGMFITVLASASNFGKLTSIQTQICGKLGGWTLWSAIGLGIQLIITIFMPQFFGWVKRGSSHVPPEIQQPEDEHQSNKIEYVNT